VYRADGIFRGVVVPPGRHDVRFSYRNPDETRGRIVAVAALAALVALAADRPKRWGAGRGRDRGAMVTGP
jgi:hypothetical protein